MSKSILCSLVHLFDQKYSRNCNIVKYLWLSLVHTPVLKRNLKTFKVLLCGCYSDCPLWLLAFWVVSRELLGCLGWLRISKESKHFPWCSNLLIWLF